MKKMLALLVLTIVCFGFTVSTECKRNACRLIKQQIVQQAGRTGVQAEEETDFHPLIFISSPFK